MVSQTNANRRLPKRRRLRRAESSHFMWLCCTHPARSSRCKARYLLDISTTLFARGILRTGPCSATHATGMSHRKTSGFRDVTYGWGHCWRANHSPNQVKGHRYDALCSKLITRCGGLRDTFAPVDTRCEGVGTTVGGVARPPRRAAPPQSSSTPSGSGSCDGAISSAVELFTVHKVSNAAPAVICHCRHLPGVRA